METSPKKYGSGGKQRLGKPQETKHEHELERGFVESDLHDPYIKS